MMTTAVNALAFRNLSLVCRNGTEAVGRITQSPFISSSSITRNERRTAACRTPTVRRQTPQASKKRSRNGGVVRFAPEAIQESEHQYDRPRAKKRRRFEASDSDKWYSRGEIRELQKSCVSALRQGNLNDDGSLDRFEPKNQKIRQVARSKAYETIRAVQAFEKATGTKAPPEMLSMLLQRYSTARVIAANNSAIRTAVACER